LAAIVGASVTYEDVRAAAGRLAGVARKTPVLTSTAVDRRTGARVFFKCESFQRAGAFKFRGAYNAIALLSEAQKRSGVITFSSGNHGQALALAAQLHGAAATVVMPADAPAVKIAATRAYGAEVILYDRLKEDREAIAGRLAAARGLALIPPFDHPHIIAGQGTAAKELFGEVGALDYLFVPLGGGGLLSGSALSARALAPACHLVGVEPENGNDGQQSLQRGRIVHIPVPDTIADGARTTHLGEHTFRIIREHVHDIVTVRDADLIQALRYMAERIKIVVEPTGALAAAAVFRGGAAIQGKRIGVLVSGGNVDAETFAGLIASRNAGS
jgi:threo-3-hydroxy-L-aspartate ammonia-lyase